MLNLWDLLIPGRWERASAKERAEARARAAQAEEQGTPSSRAKPSAKNAARPKPARKVRAAPKAAPAEQTALAPASVPHRDSTPAMADRYAQMTAHMLSVHGIRVRKWRSSMSGVAWELRYKDGSVKKLIEAPRPKGPMSAAVFLHEIGHHAIGLGAYSPRCLEEFHAWRWSLEHMEAWGLNITDAVRRRMHLSLAYAIEKARRRGLKQLPPELVPYVNRPAPRARTTR